MILATLFLVAVGFSIYSEFYLKSLCEGIQPMAKTRQLPPPWTTCWTIEEVLARPFLPEIASMPWHKLKVDDWREEQDRLIDRLCRIRMKNAWAARAVFSDDTLYLVWPWLDSYSRGLLEGMWIAENERTYVRIEREARIGDGLKF